MSIILTILTVLLIGVALFLILVVLAQKAKDGGMGAAMGGGMAEAAFGADTSNVLSKATINAAIAFFVLAFALYLGRIYQRTHSAPTGGALPAIAVPAAAPTATPAAPATATATPATADTKAVPTPTKPADQTPKKP